MKNWKFCLGSALMAMSMLGCEQKEKVIEVQTPKKSIEVERDKKTGDVNIETHDKKKLIDINVPGVDVEVQKDKAGDAGVDVDVNR